MKMPNLKNLDYKQLGIDHGEKVVIALIAIMIGGVLYGSNWKATDKSPTEMKERAEKTKKDFEERPWDEQREKRMAGLGQGNELAQKVTALLTPLNKTGFSIEPFAPPLHPDKTLISTPRWLPVQHLIADAGVAELSLRPGTPAPDDGFIRKPVKEKEPKAKNRMSRMRQREEKEAKKEKEKDDQEKQNREAADAIPEELRAKSGAGGQQGGFGGGMGLGPRMGRNRTHDNKRDKGRRMDDAPEVPQTRQVVAKPVGRGYHFIAVRGIFPLSEQTDELARAMGLPSTQKDIQTLVQFRDFTLQRQTRGAGVDQWGPWESVDRDAVIQLLENEVDGYAPETVLDGLLDGHIVMPYPERVVGQWDRLATHPDIKEFTLSDDEVQKQVEYEWKLLEKVKNEEQQGKPTQDKGGFMGVSRNMRGLANRAQAQVGDERSIREKILDELKAGTGDRDQMNEQLEEFVRTRATPVNHFLLFRYLDIKVEPGKTYRYRVQLIVANPFKERRIEEVTDPSIIEGDSRPTEWSQPTEPVTVQDNSQFYVKRIEWHPGRTSLPYATMDVFQWFAETGTVVNKELAVQLGQILGGRKQAEVLRPAESVFDQESVLFSSRDALVDVSPGFSFDSNLHKDILDDLKGVPGIKGGASAPQQAVVVDDNGELHMLDGMDQKGEYDKTKTHYEQQNKAFDALRKPAGADEDDVFGKHKQHHAGKDKNDPRRAQGFGRKGRSRQGFGGKGGGGN